MYVWHATSSDAELKALTAGTLHQAGAVGGHVMSVVGSVDVDTKRGAWKNHTRHNSHSVTAEAMKNHH